MPGLPRGKPAGVPCPHLDDARRCRQASGCESLMLGRGMVTDPGLALAIRASMPGAAPQAGVGWPELVPLLADRGVVMTSTQVYRIVTGEPERLNMRLLAALCDILDVTPNDLIEPYVATSSRRGRKTGTTGTSTQSKPSRNRPTRAVIKPAGD